MAEQIEKDIKSHDVFIYMKVGLVGCMLAAWSCTLKSVLCTFLLPFTVLKSPLCLFNQGTPTSPMCGFSNMVVRILDAHGARKAGDREHMRGAQRTHVLALPCELTLQHASHAGVKYGSSNVLADDGVREGIKQYTAWPTIPQIFIRGEFVGGCDILRQMHQNGELEKQLEGVEREEE